TRSATSSAGLLAAMSASSLLVSLSCCLPKPATPGCSTRPINSPQGWPATATPNPSTSKKTIPPSSSIGRATIASRDPPSSIPIFRSPDPARLNHPRIPHAPARAAVRKFQISLTSLQMTCRAISFARPCDLQRLSRRATNCVASLSGNGASVLIQLPLFSAGKGRRLSQAVLPAIAALALAGCNSSRNAYIPPPPAKVVVAQPVQKPVTLYF